MLLKKTKQIFIIFFQRQTSNQYHQSGRQTFLQQRGQETAQFFILRKTKTVLNNITNRLTWYISKP